MPPLSDTALIGPTMKDLQDHPDEKGQKVLQAIIRP